MFGQTFFFKGAAPSGGDLEVPADSIIAITWSQTSSGTRSAHLRLRGDGPNSHVGLGSITIQGEGAEALYAYLDSNRVPMDAGLIQTITNGAKTV